MTKKLFFSMPRCGLVKLNDVPPLTSFFKGLLPCGEGSVAAAEASEGLGPQASTVGLACEGLLERRGPSHPRLRDLAPAHYAALQDSP